MTESGLPAHDQQIEKCVVCGGVPAVLQLPHHTIRLRFCSEACMAAEPGELDDMDAIRKMLTDD